MASVIIIEFRGRFDMGHVYIGRGRQDQAFKIGCSETSDGIRVKQHHTANPSFTNCRVFETQSPKGLESRLHQHFQALRVRGTKEWFRLSDDDLRNVDHVVLIYEQHARALAHVDGLKLMKSSPSLIEADFGMESDYHRLKVLRQERARIELEEQMIEVRLKVAIGLNSGIRDFVTWRAQQQARFDSAAFRQDHYVLYESYRRPTSCRYFRLL